MSKTQVSVDEHLPSFAWLVRGVKWRADDGTLPKIVCIAKIPVEVVDRLLPGSFGSLIDTVKTAVREAVEREDVSLCFRVREGQASPMVSLSDLGISPPQRDHA